MSFLNGLYETTDIQLNGENSVPDNSTGGAEFYLISSLGEDFVIYVDGTSVFVLNSSTGVLTISTPINITSTFSVGGVLTTPVFLKNTNNLACGSGTLTSLTTGSYNYGYGFDALRSNTTGNANVSIGLNSLYSNTIGAGNTAIGHVAGDANTTGYFNSFFGHFAGSSLGSSTYAGNGCTLLGAYSKILTAGVSNSTCIGFNSFIDANLQISLGSGSENIIMRGATFMNGNLLVNGNTDLTGGNATATTQADNDKTTKVATTAFVSRMIYYNQTSHNLAINQEQYNSITTGVNNISLGLKAGYLITSGNGNTSIGIEALRSCLTGSNNFVLGQASLYSLTSGSWNVAIGVLTLANTNGSYNVGIGSYCGNISSGDFNIYIGWFAAIAATTDGTNVGIGSYCYPQLTTGKDNVAIGVSAGTGITTGTSNTFIGQACSASVGNLTFATAIGAGSQATTSNSVYLGRSTDMTYATGGLTIPSGKTLTYNGSTLSGSIVDTGTANQAITARKDFNGFDATIGNNYGCSLVSPVMRPKNFTLFQSVQNACHAMGANSATALIYDATNTAVYSLGQDCLSAKTLNTKNVTSIGGSNMPYFTNEAFNFVTALGQGHLQTETGFPMTNVTMIGSNTTFTNGAIKPSSVTNALFNEAVNGIQLASSVAISNVFAIRTLQPITKSNQGIIGDSTEIVLHSTGQKVIVTGGLNPQGFFQASIASPTLNWNSANFNMSAVTNFQMVYHLIGNSTPTAITLPSVTSAMVGQQFIFKKRGGLGACAYTITTTGGQPVFPIGGSLGTLTFPYTLLTASTQSSAQLMCVQSHFAGTGTAQVTTGGTPTLTVNTWNGLPSTMITIGTSITIAGVTKKVSAFGTGVGGPGNYQMDSNYASNLTNQAITSTDQFGYDILWVN